MGFSLAVLVEHLFAAAVRACVKCQVESFTCMCRLPRRRTSSSLVRLQGRAPAIEIMVIGFDLLAGRRRHLCPANGYSRSAARLKRLRWMAQLYGGKRPISKGFAELYEGL